MRAGLDEVFDRAAFVGGDEVRCFEEEYADVRRRRATASVSPTAPTRSSWRCARSGSPGGEVVLPANTFIATAEAVSRIGARPVLVDVDDDHLLIDPQPVERA